MRLHLPSKVKKAEKSLQKRVLLLLDFLPVIMMALFLYFYYHEELKKQEATLYEHAQLQVNLLANTLAQPLWDLNTRQIKVILQENVKSDDVLSLHVRNETKEIVEQIVKPRKDQNRIKVDHAIIYNLAGELNNLGYIEIEVTRENMIQAVQKKVRLMFIGLGLILILQIGLFNVIISSFFRPLNKITEVIRKLSSGQANVVIPSQNRSDEIGEMARALQRFKDTALRADRLTQEVDIYNRLSKELEEAKREAEAANEAKGQFLAMMSHEIRTPLNGMLGLSELLESTPLNSVQKHYMRLLNSSGSVLLSLVTDILDLTKIESGKFEIFSVATDVHQLLQDIETIYRPIAEAKGLAFGLEIVPNLPSHVMIDDVRFKQIITNLISNAIKYTEHGQVILAVAVDVIKDQQVIFVRVKDTGRGIDTEKQHAIFEKFVQVNRSDRVGGTGLGLSICRSLIDLMQGQIGVESTMGQGSVFWFHVPLIVANASVTEHVSAAEGPLVFTRAPKILVVEDIEVNRFVITEMLESLQCIVHSVENGQQAVGRLQREMFDLVFMDCNMPVLDGTEATIQIRTHHPDLPIVAVTSYSLESEREKYLAAGMNSVITKPLKKQDLVDVLRRFCQSLAT